MIITRSPLRITLGGGGTDLPSYYEQHEGFLIAAAIDKFVYITLHHMFEPGIVLKYSRLERVTRISEVEHPILRESLRIAGIEEEPALEIASMADIPAGTGLGSSGSFTTALGHRWRYARVARAMQPVKLPLALHFTGDALTSSRIEDAWLAGAAIMERGNFGT